MECLPTLLVVAHETMSQDAAMNSAFKPNENLHQSIYLGLAYGLDVFFIGPPLLNRGACDLLPKNCVLDLGDSHQLTSHDRYTQALITGICASPNAGSWLILQSNHPIPSKNTIQQLAYNLSNRSITYLYNAKFKNYSIAFTSEMFSELMQLRRKNDIQKLIARYPSVGIETNAAT